MRTFVVTTLALLCLSACKEDTAPEKTTYLLQPGEERILEIPSSSSKMVSFGFSLDSDVERDSSTCQDPENTGFPYCGRISEVSTNGEEFGSSIASWHGGGLVFEPKDGVIRVKLTSLALVDLEFEVEVTEP